ncbi:hypothetical protein GCM10018781_65950 [Kitasatospora indigofera]|uniref:Cation efflux protein cytoplasmic domain-containing protein n=1 Tax=Kitasatospora indigofera TaxID=67307 RepID=A0A919GCJ8_9ACTN|nr:hypothetical protein GCM10018781_65950 [Kitasatospora indigofera]
MYRTGGAVRHGSDEQGLGRRPIARLTDRCPVGEVRRAQGPRRARETWCAGIEIELRLGADSALLAARVDLREGMDSEEAEEVCVRIKRQLREECPAFDQVFLDIVDADSDDRDRARILERDIGRLVADQDGSEE